MSRLAAELHAEARRLRDLQSRAWELEHAARRNLDDALRLEADARAFRTAGQRCQDTAQGLRDCAKLRDGEGLTQRIEFLETQARSADRLADSLEGAARLTSDLFPDDGEGGDR